jgi:hypothetical protein
MDAHQCVYPYVSSDYMLSSMFYYTHYSNMEAPQLVHLDVPSDYKFYWTYYLAHHRGMYIPQYVSYVKKKKGNNITILKGGKNIMKCQLQISSTNIISEDLCSLSNSINLLKPNDFQKCRNVSPSNCRTNYKDVAKSLSKFGVIFFTPIQ